jgi:hypothetical protein
MQTAKFFTFVIYLGLNSNLKIFVEICQIIVIVIMLKFSKRFSFLLVFLKPLKLELLS